MMAIVKYRKKVKNYNSDPAILTRELEVGFQKIEVEDDRLRSQAELDGKGYLSYVLKEVHGVRRGIKWELRTVSSM
jgi:hypothetical protein